MTRTDKQIIAVAVAVMGPIVGATLLEVSLTDDESWSPAPNGCYVHGVHDNHLIPSDTKTVTLLCPVKP